MEERPRSCGNVSARPPQPLTAEGGACPGWRKAPVPGRGRRCPMVLGSGGGACEHAPYRCLSAPRRTEALRSFPQNAGLSGKGRSSGGRAAPLMRERFRETASAPHSRGRRLPRMAQSASPRQGQALPDGFGLRGRCVRARTLPLPSHPSPDRGVAIVSPKRRAERKRPIFRWKNGPAHAGTVPRDRFSPSQQRAGQALPGGFGPPGGVGEMFRHGRVTCPCRLRRR